MRRLRRSVRSGFTLLEVLVATTLMAIAVGTLLSSLSGSLRNAARLTERDRAALEAKRVLDTLMVEASSPDQNLQGWFDPARTGLSGGWRARIERFEAGPAGPGARYLERIVVEAGWQSGMSRRTITMEGFRIAKPARQGP